MTEKPHGDGKAAETETKAPPAPKPPRSAKPKKAGKPKKKPARRNKGGRPAWQPSIENRTLVEQMKYVGESDAMIARALKVDVDTLRKHCAYELDNGYANRRSQITRLMFEAAEEGNVSAIKRLDEMGKVSRAASAMRDRETGASVPAAEPTPKPAKMGKKEERQAAAERVAAAGKFAPPAAPKLVVNNTGGA